MDCQPNADAEASELARLLEGEVLRRCLTPTSKGAAQPEGGDSLLLKALARWSPEAWAHGRGGAGDEPPPGPPMMPLHVDFGAAQDGAYTADGDSD